jgi:hypothetical protein
MRREEDQELWDLLGRNRQPPVSAFFARDVLRRLRQEPGVLDRLRSSFNLRWLIPASGVAAVIIAVITIMEHPVSRPVGSDSLPEVVAKIDPQDYDVVADLDVLLASDENSPWDDTQNL